ncbi:siderophore-interacting protein [Nocardioides sp. Kera G14]|uniref:siderophore-interacting protein n=1 Tax=Nocardioides sp. Kera G14 TaxID=2884264 RepID=UPI001D1257E9|nr:siderophore-interacting protein [Nocardioides sp. Kera G14]UDY24840.1 siderophore-interacting protein [Nocardioides sp. Kera G14]
MSVRASHHTATVLRREQLSQHLVRIVLDVPTFQSTGVPDEWVGLIVPGQFQSRYYTVRDVADAPQNPRLTLDIVVHETGLVTEWAQRDVTGETVTITDPKGSFALPEGAQWLLLVGDLTALPAMARIAEVWTATHRDLPLRVWVETPDQLPDYLPETSAEIEWIPGHGEHLAEIVEGIDWPEGEGYFWMAGESAQMRAIRKHLMRERGLPSHAYDVMGYWRVSAGRQPRAVDPGPIYRAGKAAGLSDDQIWANYDAAQAQAGQQ